jgi:hypothetical protein
MDDGSDSGRGLETSEWPGLSAAEAAAGLNKEAMAAIIDFSATLWSRMAAVNGEWAAFVGKRWLEDFRLSQQIAACRSPDQFLTVYGAFLQKSFEQYQAEFVHMLKLGQVFASRNADMLKKNIEATLRAEAPHEPEAQRPKTSGGNRRYLAA